MVRKLKIIGTRRSALLEIFLFLIIVTISSYIFGTGDRYFSVYPHPFWLVVLLMATQYGANEALVAALVSSVFLLAFNLPEQQIDENIYDYMFTVSLRPMLWLSAAVIFGQIRQRHLDRHNELEKNLHKAITREEKVSKAYDDLKEVKEVLESRVASQLSSTALAYGAIKSIEKLNQSQVLLGVEDVVIKVMNPEKFSIYALGPTGFEPVTCSGWSDKETYSRRFGPKSKLYQEIVGKQRMLCCVSKQDSEILEDEGLLAAPLMDYESGELFGMLKIEKIDFTMLTLGNIETFRIICELVGIAYSNAGKYSKLKKQLKNS